MKAGVTREQLIRLHRAGRLRDIDFYLAESLACGDEGVDGAVLMAAALASRAIGEGHLCLDLADLAGRPWPSADEDGGAERIPGDAVLLPRLSAWLKALRSSPVCGSGESPDKPLVLVEGRRPRVYLRRYYQYERRLAEALVHLAAARETRPLGQHLQARIRELFPDRADGSHEEVRRAAAVALERRLLIVSGGPGTGKTHTLARLLVLLVEEGNDPLRSCVIRMAAPTGKAAMRMRESIRAAKAEIALPAAESARIPEDACTIHRLLGTRVNQPHFRYGQDNPLPADVVIIDEASMVDLPLMTKLIDALGPETRLILLGDMHQLSSVEPGYVLGDLCSVAAQEGSVLAPCLVELTHSWRFPATGPVASLGRALQAAGGLGDPEAGRAWTLLQEWSRRETQSGDQVLWHDCPPGLHDAEGRVLRDLRQLVLESFAPFLAASDVAGAFSALQRFRVLCAVRQGAHGVAMLNRLIVDILSLKNMVFKPGRPDRPERPLHPAGPFYDHRVVMVSANDYGLRLFNGDIGIILPASAGGIREAAGGGDPLMAWFEAVDEVTGEPGFRALPCSLLPEHETAFAMTVHKAQGSQFENVLVILPHAVTPLLSKELLYTGVTRARKQVSLWCCEAAFRQAAISPARRRSGLADALMGR